MQAYWRASEGPRLLAATTRLKLFEATAVHSHECAALQGALAGEEVGLQE